MDDFISDLLRQLTESLDDIMAIEDEKFALAQDLALQAITMTLSGTQADYQIGQAVAANKAAGISRSQMIDYNELLKDTLYNLIQNGYKTRYNNPNKHEFLDSFYSLVEKYTDKMIQFWDLETPVVYVQRLHENAKLPSVIFINVLKIFLWIVGIGGSVFLAIFIYKFVKSYNAKHPNSRRNWKKDRRKQHSYNQSRNSSQMQRRRQAIKQAKRRQKKNKNGLRFK